MARTMTKDLTEGRPLKLVLSFAAPLLFGMLFQQFYSFVDTAIVGRYLEHSRVYVFGSGASERMYISSADFMTRNTERRVEIACPILDSSIRREIHVILDCCFRDNLKARRMKSDGHYTRIKNVQEPFSSQDELMRITPASDQTIPLPQRRKAISAFKTIFREEPEKKKK